VEQTLLLEVLRVLDNIRFIVHWSSRCKCILN